MGNDFGCIHVITGPLGHQTVPFWKIISLFFRFFLPLIVTIKAPSIFSAQAFRAIGLIVGPLIYLYLFCLLGQLVTNRSLAVSIAAYTYTQWYDYSPSSRKYILMTIAYSQIDFNMMALGFVKCNMASFKTVIFSQFILNSSHSECSAILTDGQFGC